jgi:predicted permease
MRGLRSVFMDELVGSGSLRRLGQDVRYAGRLFTRTPVLTAAIVLTLALGIGATTGVFSIVQAVLLRPLPYRDPGRLVAIWDGHVRAANLSKVFASYEDFQTWRRHSTSFDQLAAITWASGEQILTGRGPAKVALSIPATSEFFSLLGIRAAHGRTFQAQDLERGCVVVLAHHFWRDALGSAADAVGGSVTLDHQACTVVGVMPATFRFFPEAADLWRLIGRDDQSPVGGVGVFGRLKAGVSRESAQAELAALHARAATDDVHRRSLAPSVLDLHDEFTWLAGRHLRLTLIVLFVAVGFVLLIACVNVATLLLGRAATRQREFAVRAALGSGRLRLLRQLLTECLLLAAAGALFGTLLAAAGVWYFRLVNPVDLPAGVEVHVDRRVLVFAGGVAVLTAFVFGLAPAWSASRADVGVLLKSVGRSATPHSLIGTLGKGLVVAETTCSVVLPVGASLLIGSVARLGTTPLGFDPTDLHTVTVRLSATPAATTARADFYDRLLLAAGRLPGLEGAALATGLLRGRSNDVLAIRGRSAPSPESAVPDVAQDIVSAGYFAMMGVPLQAGRWFDAGDREGAEPVAIVNETLVRTYFRGEPVLGRYVRYGSDPAAPWLRIVGVAGAQKSTNVHQEMNWVDAPFLFRPIRQAAPAQATLILRAPPAAGNLGPAVSSMVATIDPDVPVGRIQTVAEHIAKTLAYPTFRARLLGGFAALALFLAAAGLYGAQSQLVAQRRQEIAIRMALGARRSTVLGLVATQGLLLAGTGLAVGLALALWLGRWLRTMLYAISPTDPALLAMVSVLLATTALIATWLPARRAMRIDPIVVLRRD